MQALNQWVITVSKKFLFASVSAALLLSANPAKAILNINIFDDGTNLIVVTSGTLSALGNPLLSSSCGPNGELFLPIFICAGGGLISSPAYLINGPAGLGGTANLVANSGSGPFFAINTSTGLSGAEQIYSIDSSYVAGEEFLSSSTFNNTSLADLGFTIPGLVGTWSIIGTSEFINVFVGPPSAEVPGPLPLFGAAAAFGWSRRMRRRITAPVITPPQN